eukprot:CAMPEP_0168624668 /NCGR_PEP_ID=MMETSP0449_2-20121227/9557_1 /TAXON_ID=1082188 /ORGANISM="Strombidium rassoulzadegani, Strain ras09" /LENGTH=86 /DNA_ID=CAMNT_0008666283 /DNA_START=242 /DNA_END=499 /DNA_ORIENTATION=+
MSLLAFDSDDIQHELEFVTEKSISYLYVFDPDIFERARKKLQAVFYDESEFLFVDKLQSYCPQGVNQTDSSIRDVSGDLCIFETDP